MIHKFRDSDGETCGLRLTYSNSKYMYTNGQQEAISRIAKSQIV